MKKMSFKLSKLPEGPGPGLTGILTPVHVVPDALSPNTDLFLGTDDLVLTKEEVSGTCTEPAALLCEGSSIPVSCHILHMTPRNCTVNIRTYV